MGGVFGIGMYSIEYGWPYLIGKILGIESPDALRVIITGHVIKVPNASRQPKLCLSICTYQNELPTRIARPSSPIV